MTTPADKAGWRARLLARRRARTAAEVRDARRRITAHLLPLASPGLTVCAYLPLPTEPLDPSVPGALTRRGTRVLVPVARAATALDWCVWDPDAIRRGSFGVGEPTGPRLGAEAIGRADIVLVPALAVDRSGVRLGRGGGHYDRSLALLGAPLPGDSSPRDPSSGNPSSGNPSGGDSSSGNPSARSTPDRAPRRPRLIAVIFDDEAMDALPHDALDRPVTDVVTPGDGIRPRPVASEGGDGASSD